MKRYSVFAWTAFMMILSGAGHFLRAGSLWREAVTDEKGMYADKLARRIGDVLTIVVEEKSVTTSGAVLSSTKTGSGTPGLAGNVLNMFIKGANTRLATDKNSVLGPDPKIPVLDPKGVEGSFPGVTSSGNLTNSFTVEKFRMAVQVIDKLPNGNLVIEGIRQVGLSRERQFASLRGIVRPYDINSTPGDLMNTVDHTKVADARIDIVSEGALSDQQKKGWLLRVDEKISPY